VGVCDLGSALDVDADGEAMKAYPPPPKKGVPLRRVRLEHMAIGWAEERRRKRRKQVIAVLIVCFGLGIAFAFLFAKP
jgi:hypothetical protein